MPNSYENHKVIDFSSISDNEFEEVSAEYLENPEEAKPRIERFLDTLTDECVNLIKFSNSGIIKQDEANLETYRSIIKKDNLTYEERKYIIDKIAETKKDIKHERFKHKATVMIIVGTLIIGVIATKKINRHA